MTIYIYIFTNLLSTSIHGYQEKEKKNRENLEITISRITAWGKKKKNFGEKKKKKRKEKKKKRKRKGPTSSKQLKKSRDMQSVGQKNKNPP